MTFHEFLESRHFTTTIANKDDAYSPFIASEIRAVKFWIDLQMSVFKYISIFKIVFIYLASVIGLLDWPKQSKIIIEEYNAKAMEVQKQAQAKAAQDKSSDKVVPMIASVKPKPVS